MSLRLPPPTLPPIHTADHKGRDERQFEEAREIASLDTVSPIDLRTASTFERG